MRKVVGIDPGVTGALVSMSGSVLDRIVDMPVLDGRVSVAQLILLLEMMEPDVVVIERTQPMPKNGSIASYSLGFNTGVLHGVVATMRLPMMTIRPQEWKKSCGIAGSRRGKDAARALCMEWWPHHSDYFRLVKHAGRADAALIARAYELDHPLEEPSKFALLDDYRASRFE